MRRTLRIWLVLALAGGGAVSWGDQRTISPADMQMAEEFAAMGSRTLERPNPTTSNWSESEALLMAAQKLNPAESRFARQLALYATHAGDTPEIIQGDKDILALQPGHRGAQCQLIDIYLAQMETADQKINYLHSIIDKQTLGPEIRSYAAMRLAYVQLERSEAAAAKATIGQAINLNPLNLEALRAQYRIVEDNGSLLEKTIACLGLLRADPADPDMIWRLAAYLSQSGLEKEAIPWYELAAQAMPRSGQGLPEDLLVDYYSAICLSGDIKATSQAVDKALSGDPGAPRLWLLKAALDRQQNSPHLADTIAKANVAYYDIIQDMRKRTGVSDATTRPVDLGEPVTLPDMMGDSDKVIADKTGMLRHYYANNIGDWAWLEIYFAHKPDDAEPMIQLLTHLIPGDDPILHRLRGWAALDRSDFDGAQSQFAAAPNDPLSEMGMVEIERRHDVKAAQSHARKVLSEHSVGLTGAMLYCDLKGQGVDLVPSNESQAILEQLKRFPIAYMDILAHPSSYYAIHIDPEKTSYEYDEPMLVRIAIQNLTGVDLTVGDDALIRPTILLDAQQRGIGDQLYPGIAYDNLNSAMLLRGGDEISQIVRIDGGSFGKVLMDDPASELQYTLLATSNPVPVKGKIYVGLGGFRVQMPRVIERMSTDLSSESGRERVMQMLQSSDGGQKIRALVLLANYTAQYLAQPNPTPESKKAANDLMKIIDQNSHTGTTSVDAIATFAMARLQTGGSKWDALQKLASDPDWEKQLLAAYAYADAPADTQKKVYTDLSNGNHDVIVKKYAAARLAALEHPATQP